MLEKVNIMILTLKSFFLFSSLLKIKSFSDINLNEVAKLSKYSKTTIYQHFDSGLNLLYLDTLISFRDELLSKINLTEDPILIFINI